MQTLSRAELFVREFVLSANPEDNCPFLFKKRKVTLEIVRFFRAAASEILRIEIQNHPLAAKILEADWLAILRVQGEIWRRCADGGRFCCVVRSASRHESHQQ